MAPHYQIAVTILILSILLPGLDCRPSETERPSPVYVGEKTSIRNSESESTLWSNKPTPEPENTKDIMDKIKKLNEGLTKPQRQQLNLNNKEPAKQYITLDDDTLKKLQMLLTTGKFQPLSQSIQHTQENKLSTNELRSVNAKALSFQGFNQNPLYPPALVGLYSIPAYTTTNVPVLVAPNVNDIYGSYGVANIDNMNSIEASNAQYTRQRPPSLPFNIPWPLASIFPVIVKDPLVTFLQGGSWNNLLEYGQNADVCNRKQKATENISTENMADKQLRVENFDDTEAINAINADSLSDYSSREGRAIKKRTVSSTPPEQLVSKKLTKATKKIFGTKNKIVTKKPTQPIYEDVDDLEDTKVPNPNEGDLRFPFSDFTWFGNKKPVAPSPGFFINRLKVRRGGVAIAGPGGVATAGRGGTAIVGPGGLAYTQPGGMAVAGPAAKVFALSPDADLNHIIAQLHKTTTNDGTVPRTQPIPEGKLVATGPVIYFHEPEKS